LSEPSRSASRPPAEPVAAFRLLVPAASEDDVAALLWETDTLGLEVRPADSGAVEVVAYFEDAPGLAERIAAALAGLSASPPERIPVPDVDWVARFRESFRAFDVGPFWIAPAWDEERPTAGMLLRVDPGRAFGTGTHESTRLCLRALAALAEAAPLGDVLDVGTGSGILAVAAARLAARRVVALDNDTEAASSAAAHARLNEVDVAVLVGDAGACLRPSRFDLVLANLSAPLLRARARELALLPRAGGCLLLAGLLAVEADDVRACFAEMDLRDQAVDGEWAALVLIRRAAVEPA
jgi:ribosomal protein L11 methyltransferase